MFGTVIEPPAADTVVSIGPTSQLAATRITPPGFASFPGSGNRYGNGSEASQFQPSGRVAGRSPVVVMLAVAGSPPPEAPDGSPPSSSEPQPTSEASSKPAPPSPMPPSTRRRLMPDSST